jgi:tRNA(Ile)-lysidine synthase
VLRVAVLTDLRPAVRSRVLRGAALAAGCAPTALTAGHVRAVDALVTDWHGQREVTLPGGVTARRRHGFVIVGRDGGGAVVGGGASR